MKNAIFFISGYLVIFVFSILLIFSFNSIGQPLNYIYFLIIIPTFLSYYFLKLILKRNNQYRSDITNYLNSTKKMRDHSLYFFPLLLLPIITTDSFSGYIFFLIIFVSFFYVNISMAIFFTRKTKKIKKDKTERSPLYRIKRILIPILILFFLLSFPQTRALFVKGITGLINTELSSMDKDLHNNKLSVFSKVRLGIYFSASPILLYLTFNRTAARLTNAWLNGYMPGKSIIRVFRKQIEKKKSFSRILKRNESNAKLQGQKSYLRRYVLHKIDMKLFGMPGVNDNWAVRVLSVRSGAQWKTHYLFRPGMVFEESNLNIVTTIKKDISGSTIVIPVRLFVMSAIKYKFGKPYFLNITDSDKTSSVSRKKIDLNEWVKSNIKLNY